MQKTYKAQWEYAAVFLGGMMGSSLREIIVPSLPSFEWVTSTFVVNIFACLVLGWLYAVRHRLHAHFIHLGAVGFCGGLSTFSTLAAEIFNIISAGAYWAAIRASAAEVFVGISAALIGEIIGRRYHSGEPQ